MTRRHEPVLTLPRGKYGRRRQHWLAARRTGITATDAAALLGVDPYMSPLGLYAKKLGAPDEAGEAAYWGTALEHVVATEWAKRNRHAGRIKPTPGLLAHPARPWQMATIDRYVLPVFDLYDPLIADWLITDPRFDEPAAVLECKTTDKRFDEDWSEDGLPPMRVLAQVTHQMLVTGVDLAHVAVLVGGNRYRQWEIPFDAELAEQITDLEAAFLDRLERRDPPAPIGHDADDAALDWLFDEDRGTGAEVDPVLVQQRQQLDAAIKAAEVEKKRLEQQIKAQLGAATEGAHPDTGTPLVTYREQTRKSYTVPDATFRVLRFKPSTKADAPPAREESAHADATA